MTRHSRHSPRKHAKAKPVPRVVVMTLEPVREVGPPVRCRRCGCLAECPIEFAGCSPDENGTQMVFNGKVCESCWEVSRQSLTEFFAKFRR